MSNIGRRWVAFTQEQAEEGIDEAKQGTQDTRELAEGSNVLRFFPSLIEGKKPFRLVWRHFIKDLPGATGPVVFTCPRLSPGDCSERRPCAACTKFAGLSSSGNPADRQFAENWSAKQAAYWVALDRAKPNEGPGLYRIPPGLHKKILAFNSPLRGGDFCDPDGGFDIVIDRHGTGFQTKYDACVAGYGRCALAEDDTQMNAWFDLMPNIEHYAALPTDEEMHAKLGAYLHMPSPMLPQAPPPRAALPTQTAPKPPVSPPPMPAIKMPAVPTTRVVGAPPPPPPPKPAVRAVPAPPPPRAAPQQTAADMVLGQEEPTEGG